MMIQEILFAKQLKGLSISVPQSSMSSIQIWFKAGSSFETPSEMGMAHFLEHMFFKGSIHYPGQLLTKKMESFGAEVNAFTSFDYTCYYINTPSSYTYQCLELLLDMVAFPTFPEEDIPAERQVVFEEYLRSQDSPQQFGFQQIQTNCFQPPYQHPILGTKETILQFSKKQLTDFRTKHYHQGSAYLVMAGEKLDIEKIHRICEKYPIPEAPSHYPLTSHHIPHQFSCQPYKSESIHIHQKDVPFNTLHLIIPAHDYLTPEGVEEDLALTCLCFGESSRFFKELVFKTSLANSVHASTMYFPKGAAHFFSLQFPENNTKKVYERFAFLWDQLFKTPLTQKELDKIKNQYMASKIYEKESLEQLAFSYGQSYVQTGNYLAEKEFLKLVEESSLEKINEAARNLLKKPIYPHLQLPQQSLQKKNPIDVHKKNISDLLKDIKKISLKKHDHTNDFSLSQSAYDPSVTCHKLTKTIDLIHKKNTTTPSFYLQIYITGGLFHDGKHQGAHFLLSSLLDKGYKNYSYEQLKLFLESHSASLRPFAGKNSYGLTLHGLSKDFSSLMKHFLSSFFNSTFESSTLEHEKTLTTRSLEQMKKDPAKVCFKELHKILFKNHPYAQDLLGTVPHIQSTTVSRLKKLHTQNLKNQQISLVYSGDLSSSEVIETCQHYFHEFHLERKKINKHKITKPKKIKPFIHHIPFDREQTHLMMAYQGYALSDTEDLYLKIITTYLSGQSSPLFTEMRDKQGLCYVVRPVHFTALHGGYWGIYMASGQDKASQAFSALKLFLKQLQTKGIDQKEFEQIKRSLAGQHSMSLQTNEDYANFYGPTRLYGLPLDFFHQHHENTMKLTCDKTNDFLRQFLNKPLITLSIGREAPSS